MPIGASKVGALGGLVPGGSVTFNTTDTWVVPPGVKVVSITGKGGTGNPGVAGNSGNPGNPGSGGGGAGSNFGSRDLGCGVQQAPGNPGGVAFKPAITNIWGNGAQLYGAAPCGWGNPTHFYQNATNRNLYAMPIAQGGLRTCPYQGSIRPGFNTAVNGCAGGTGNAGTAGCGGTAGNAGQASSALCNTFPGGQGGNAPPGGAAGNGGSGGQGGSGTTGGNSAGNGGNGANYPGNNAGPPGPTAVPLVVNATGGGGAGTVNAGQSGNNVYRVLAPWLGPQGNANNNPLLYVGLGGSDPAMVANFGQAQAANGIPPTYYCNAPFYSTQVMGGNGGGPSPGPGAGNTAIFGREPNCLAPKPGPSQLRQCIGSLGPTPLRPTLVRSGGGGGGGSGASGGGSQLTASPGAGGGGRGNAGNAGGNSPTVSGQAATPLTFNCVPVTPGAPYPITIGGPSGGQIVISWNPQ